MKTIEFALQGDVKKSAKAFGLIRDYSRFGIIQAFVNGEIEELNIVELMGIFDYVYEGRTDFIPEFMPHLNGYIDIEVSKEYWGWMWTVIFGENGEHWGKTLKEAKEISFGQMHKALSK